MAGSGTLLPERQAHSGVQGINLLLRVGIALSFHYLLLRTACPRKKANLSASIKIEIETYKKIPRAGNFFIVVKIFTVHLSKSVYTHCHVFLL